MINANSFSITTPTSEFVKSHLTVGRNQREKKGCRVEIFYMVPQENSVLGIGGQAPSAHGRGSTFFSARGGSIFSKQGGVRGGVPWKKNSLEFLKSAIREGKTAPKIDITNLLQKCNVFFTKL